MLVHFQGTLVTFTAV